MWGWRRLRGWRREANSEGGCCCDREAVWNSLRKLGGGSVVCVLENG